MGDLIIALSAIAAALALYHKIQRTRALKRLIKLLEDQKRATPGPTSSDGSGK